MIDYLISQSVSNSTELVSVIFTILMSFLLSTSIGVTYVKTFKGLSYSRNYVQALVLSSIVAATVMHAIGDSLARGLGMIGALAIIRFRTSFKDSKDILPGNHGSCPGFFFAYHWGAVSLHQHWKATGRASEA